MNANDPSGLCFNSNCFDYEPVEDENPYPQRPMGIGLRDEPKDMPEEWPPWEKPSAYLTGTDVGIAKASRALKDLGNMDADSLLTRTSCDDFFSYLRENASYKGQTRDFVQAVLDQAKASSNSVYDGPSSREVLNPASFPDTTSTYGNTVGDVFKDNNVHGLSEFNGNRIWVRGNEWDQSHYNDNGTPRPYGLGLLTHEVLHKQNVGAFLHVDIDNAIKASGSRAPSGQREERAGAIGKAYF